MQIAAKPPARSRWAICSIIALVALCRPSGASAAGRVFVEFDGVTLSTGEVDDAPALRTAIAALAMPLPPYEGDAAQRAALLASMRADWDAYAIEFVDVRPTDDDWSMAVVTSATPLGAGIAGVAVLDCDDERGLGEIVFGFASADTETLALGATLSQELAHTLGLEHVDEPRDLLHPLATGGDAEFLDECVALVEGWSCDQAHLRHCDPGAQNAHAELLRQLGPAAPDQESPQVELVSPADGDRVAAGSDLQVVVEASDDTRVDRVVLFEGDRELGEDRTPPWEFVVAAVPAGSYSLRARAIDSEGHERDSETVALTVEFVGVPGGFSRGGEPTSGCRVGGSSAPGSALLMLLLGASRRRGRRVVRSCSTPW